MPLPGFEFPDVNHLPGRWLSSFIKPFELNRKASILGRTRRQGLKYKFKLIT